MSRDRHGPWAVVAGASEGLGAAWSRALAVAGLDLVLVARRVQPLEEQAAHLRLAYGVEVVTVPADLGAEDAMTTLDAVLCDRDVGLLVYNACASFIGPFLSLGDAQRATTIDVNVVGLTRCLGLLAPRLVARGRGGIVLMSSLSGFQGSAMVGLYAATKAFDTVLGESLWEELGPRGIDVLVCAAGATLTPNFERETPAARRGGAFPKAPDDVVAEAVAGLGSVGPTLVPGRLNRVVHGVLSRLPRWAAVRFISRNTRRMYAEAP